MLNNLVHPDSVIMSTYTLESREQYHHSHNPNFFHIGHFRIVKRNIPNNPRQVISHEFYGVSNKEGFEIYHLDLTKSGTPEKVGNVATEVELSSKSYELASLFAKSLAKERALPVIDCISRLQFLPSGGLEQLQQAA